MTSQHRTRAFVAAGIAFLLSVAGAVAWSAAATWSAARTELDNVARSVDARSVQVRMEGLRIAGQLADNESCNRAELRKLVANTHYVRDIGRIHGNHIYCNSMDGPEAHIDLGAATVSRADGMRMWINPRGVWAARGHSVLRMDPMSLVDMSLPPDVVIALIEPESGKLMTHSAPLPKGLVRMAKQVGRGRFRHDGFLASVSTSEDGRTIDLAARPSQSVQAVFLSGLSNALGAGAFVGLLLGTLVLSLFARHYSMMSELRRALKRRELTGALQPIVSVSAEAGARVIGFECLARWTRPDGREVSPKLFVPMIEAAGLGSELARCMVGSLIADFGDALRAHPELYVALNLSSADVADGQLLDDIDGLLAAGRVPTGQVVIELTERTFEAEGLASGLARLRRAGHRLSIDDFGTGASNASRLASFNPEMVKVDRSFLLHADTDSHASELLPQLVAMAHGCGAKVVIEGVETAAQAGKLAGFGEVFAQGYYWHRPMTAADAARLLAAQAPAASADKHAPVEA